MSWKSRFRITWLLFFFVVLSACSGPPTQLAPTPFPTAGAPEGVTVEGPLTLTISEIANSLGLYEDAQVIVTGRLQRQPLLVCDSDPQPSPASWALTDDGAILLASEFDQQIRTLLPDNLTMTVEGRLRRWEGPVGCGKQAQQREVWYLEASRILSPRTLTQATLTPSGLEPAATEIAAVIVTEAPGETLTVTELPTAALTPVDVPAATPTTDGSVTQPTPEPSVTPESPVDEPTPPTAPVLTPSATVTGTITATPGAGTPTTTPAPDAATATTAAGLATATTSVGQVVDKGYIDEVEGDFPAASLASGQIHSWTVDIYEDEPFDIKVIAPVPGDIALSLIRDGQTIIDRQNQSPAGSAEVLAIDGQPEGTYELRVQTVDGRASEYIMVLSFEDDFQLELMGFLASGAPRNNVTLNSETSHYWNFTAAAGNRITITVTPDALSDAYVYLYGPGGVEIDQFDDGDVGEVEVVEYTVTGSGLHTIVIEDLESEEMVYSILVTIQP